MSDSFPKILAISAVVTDDHTHILLRKRDKEPDRDMWELFAGYVQPGERLTEAVVRKLRDKASIHEIDSIVFTGRYYDDPDRHPGSFCIPFVFSVVVQHDSVITSETVRWFSLQEIEKEKLALDNKRIIQDIL